MTKNKDQEKCNKTNNTIDYKPCLLLKSHRANTACKSEGPCSKNGCAPDNQHPGSVTGMQMFEYWSGE